MLDFKLKSYRSQKHLIFNIYLIREKQIYVGGMEKKVEVRVELPRLELTEGL